MARAEASVDMTRGRPLPLVIRFTLPILLGNIFQQLYTVVDGIVVGKNVSDAAQAAVGASFSVTYMLTSLFLGIGLGGSVLVSQYFGQHNESGIRKTISTMNSFLLVISLPLMLFGFFTAGPFLHLLKVPDDYFDLARTYMCVYYLGLLPQFGYNANAGILQGLGDSRSPLLILASSSILHVILDYVLVVPIPLGVVGVGLATVISQFFSWLLSVWIINHKFPAYRFRVFRISFDKEIFREILRIGVPVALQDGLIQIAFLFITVIANRRGLTDAAAVGIVEKIISFLFLVPSSMLSTVSALGAQCIGAGKPRRALQTLWYAIAIAFGFGILISVIIQFVAEPVVGLFTDSAAVAAAGGQYLRGYIFDCCLAGLHFCFSGYFCAIGRSELSFLHNITAVVLVRVPGAYLTSKWFPTTLLPMGLATAAGSLLSVIICVIAFLVLRRRGRLVPEED